MSEISLYRKYRPQNFAHLVGQEHIRTTLLNALKTGNAAHAYLFCGPRGTGKTSTARLMAKALNCLHPKEDFEPCDECDLCRDISDGRLIDLVEIDAASNRGIDEIRDLKEKIHFAPTRAKNKIYIIDEVHMLTKEAFNALLKTLEEPPDQVFFILATTEAYKIPATIISRCQRFDFRRIEGKILMTRLSYIAQSEGIEAEDMAIEAIARISDGGLRDAIGLLEQLTHDKKLTYTHVREVLGLSDRQAVENLYQAIVSQRVGDALVCVQTLQQEGHDLIQFTRTFLDFLREKMLESVAEQNMSHVSAILGYIDSFQKTLEHLRYSPIPQLPLEIAVIESCGVRAMEASESMVTPNPPPSAPPAPPAGLKAVPSESAQSQSSSEALPELTFEAIKSHWPRIFERITLPLVQRSLKDATVKSVSGQSVVLEFKTKFHMDNIENTSHKVDIEHIFFEVFGKRIKLETVLQEVSLSSTAPKPTSPSLTDAALDIFGGEVVEG